MEQSRFRCFSNVSLKSDLIMDKNVCTMGKNIKKMMMMMTHCKVLKQKSLQKEKTNHKVIFFVEGKFSTACHDKL